MDFISYKAFNGLKDNDYYTLAGLVNFSWQSWCHLWRSFWMANLEDSYDLKGNIQNKLQCNCGITYEEKAFFLKQLISNGNINHISPLPYYKEPTWGGLNTIQELSIKLERYELNRFQDVIAACGTFNTSILHFQKLRNSLIHLNSPGVKAFKNEVLIYYTCRNFQHPLDILFTTPLMNQQYTYQLWFEEMESFIRYVFK